MSESEVLIDGENMTMRDLGQRFKETKKEYYFNQIYYCLYDNLFNYIQKIVKDADMTQDVLNRAMSKAFYKIDQYDHNYSITTWIYKIAYNISIKELKNRSHEKFVPEFFDNSYEEKEVPLIKNLGLLDLNDYEKNISINEERERRKKEEKDLKKIIDRTDDMYREILRDRYLLKLDYKELMKVHGMNLQTIKNRLHRGKKEMLRIHEKRQQKKR